MTSAIYKLYEDIATDKYASANALKMWKSKYNKLLKNADVFEELSISLDRDNEKVAIDNYRRELRRKNDERRKEIRRLAKQSANEATLVRVRRAKVKQLDINNVKVVKTMIKKVNQEHSNNVKLVKNVFAQFNKNKQLSNQLSEQLVSAVNEEDKFKSFYDYNDVLRNKFIELYKNGGEMTLDTRSPMYNKAILYNMINTFSVKNDKLVKVCFTRNAEKYSNDTFWLILNEKNISDISKVLEEGGTFSSEYSTVEGRRSVDDYEAIQLNRWKDWDSITIQVLSKDDVNMIYEKNEGAFFPFFVNKEIYQNEWCKYGLFSEAGKEFNEYNKDSCLVVALKNSFIEKRNKSGELVMTDDMLNNDEILLLQSKVVERFVPATKLTEIGKLINCEIIVRNIKEKSVDEATPTRTLHYNEGAPRSITIGNISKHYFCIDYDTNITTYAIKNYDDVKHVERFNLVTKYVKKRGKYERTTKTSKNSRITDSHTLIRLLLIFKEKFLKEITISDAGILNSPFHTEVIDKIGSLEYNEKNETNRIYYPTPQLYCQTKEVKRGKQIMKLFKKKVDGNGKPLNYVLKDLNCQEYKTMKEKNYPLKRRIVCADFECHTEGEKHMPYVVCTYDGDKTRTFAKKGDNYYFIGDFLNSLKDGDLVLMHNLGYDVRIIIKFAPFNVAYQSFISGGRNCYQVLLLYKNKKVTLRDSYPMISEPLSGFKKFFGINIEKEIMNYDIYTIDNINERDIPIKDYIQPFWKEDDVDKLNKNIKKWNCETTEGRFNHVLYAQKYCEMDVKVLYEGYIIFRQWMFKLCENVGVPPIDITDILTIGSLAKTLLNLSGCFDGCFELSGIPQMFIQKSVVGGRCMVKDNKAFHIKLNENNYEDPKMSIQLFDCNSLYPSAMSRLDGLLKGRPKVIKDKDLSLKQLERFDYYYVEIDVINIPKKLHFPCISSINEKGVRMFDNNFRGKTITDKVTIGDLISFHEMKEGIDFKIVRGYYFSSGFNKRITEVIRLLYDQRSKIKKSGNPVEKLYKLIMNASYGKMIEKPKKTKKRILCGDEADKFIFDNRNKIISVLSINEHRTNSKHLVEMVEPIHNHYNQCHQGSYILSMSKRIMNEMMTVAQDNNIDIYYTDTDSVHVLDGKINCDVPNLQLLQNKFKEKYNKELVGKELGQFHCDFPELYPSDVLPYSVEGYFLAKKVYHHSLRYYCKTNKKDYDTLVEKSKTSERDQEKLDKLNSMERIDNESSVAFFKELEYCKLKGVPKTSLKDSKSIFKVLAQNKPVLHKISDDKKKYGMRVFEYHRNFDISFNDVMDRTSHIKTEVTKLENIKLFNADEVLTNY